MRDRRNGPNRGQTRLPRPIGLGIGADPFPDRGPTGRNPEPHGHCGPLGLVPSTVQTVPQGYQISRRSRPLFCSCSPLAPICQNDPGKRAPLFLSGIRKISAYTGPASSGNREFRRTPHYLIQNSNAGRPQVPTNSVNQTEAAINCPCAIDHAKRPVVGSCSTWNEMALREHERPVEIIQESFP